MATLAASALCATPSVQYIELICLARGLSASTSITVAPRQSQLIPSTREGAADVGGLDRTDAGSLVGRAGRGQDADPAPVRPCQRGGLRRGVPRRAARAGTAQDRLDARRGGGRSRPLAAAGRVGAQPLGRRRAA